MRAKPLLSAVLMGLAATLTVACGSTGKGLIPAQSAGPLKNDFEAVAQAAQAGDGNCTNTATAIRQTEQDFAALPASVDRGLHRRLEEGVSNLRNEALTLCAQPHTSTEATTTLSTSTTTSKSTPSTSTTSTSTTSTETTSTQTTAIEAPSTTTPSGPGGGTQAPGGGSGPGTPGAGGATPGAGNGQANPGTGAGNGENGAGAGAGGQGGGGQ